jgi:methionyl-tRNA formyltransferase
MKIDAGLDTGPMLLKHETAIGPDETAPELAARLAEAGAPLMVETLRKLERGEITPTPQDNSKATHAPPLKKEDGRIDWNLPAAEIYNRIRGLQPWPGAFTSFRGKTCRIWGKPLKPVAAGGMPGIILPTKEDGLLVICGGPSVFRVDYVQMEGRKRVTGMEFANGARIAPGEQFGT